MSEISESELMRRISGSVAMPAPLRTYAILRLKKAKRSEIAERLNISQHHLTAIESAAEGQLASFLSLQEFKAFVRFCTIARAPKIAKIKKAPVAVPSAALSIRISEEAQSALAVLEGTRDHIFLTGRAGTGKSTLLNEFRKTTKKTIVVLAPTGVAALNVSGQTIHSFFSFGLSATPGSIKKVFGEKAKLYKKLDAIVIDEVSMARADIIDCIDERLRMNGPDPKKPFGGVQMIFVGDMLQLPPVVTREEEAYFSGYYKSPFFFDAHVFSKVKLRLVELTRIWRQSNARFIDVLDRIRRNDLRQEHLDLLNTRHSTAPVASRDEFVVTLTTTNAAANAVNDFELARLSGGSFEADATVSGNFDARIAPAPEHLLVKEGAQVMLLNNDKQGRWVNGDIGVVSSVSSHAFSVRLLRGEEYDIPRVSWDMLRYEWNEVEKRVDSIPLGSFSQYPVRLAWAVTIHKGQGKTFPKVIVDFGKGTFAPGQAYVALSRCTSLEGITLRRPFTKNHIQVNPRVIAFTDSLRCDSSSFTKDSK